VDLKEIEKQIEACCKCEICKSITHKVPGEWTWKAWIMFVWEAPWRQEDLTGKPFVWPAWKILTNLIENILKLKREDVFITSVLKCRPPKNRDPLPQEIENCWPFLQKQIEILDPKILVALGRFAARTLIWDQISISKMRWKLFQNTKVWKPVFVIYHPAVAIYNPNLKKVLEEDFRKLRQIYEKINTSTKTISRSETEI